MSHRLFRRSVWALAGFLLTSPTPAQEDCNRNRVADAEEIATGVSADVNADGVPDECELTPLRLSLFEGDLVLPGNVRTFLIADLDLDGLSDVVWTADDEAGSSLGVLRSRGDATFGPIETFNAGEGVVAVVALDWNRDGVIDIAVSSPDAIHVLLGEAAGLGNPLELARPGGPVLETADLTGDGQSELILVAAATLTVLRPGEGAAVDSIATETGSASPAAVATADYDGDGKLDVALVARTRDVVTVLHGLGDGSFSAALDTELGTTGPRALVAGDLDGDGDNDWVVGRRSSVAFLRDEGEQFGPPAIHSSGGTLTSLVLGDFDGDADLDLLTATSLDYQINVWQNAGDGPLFDTGALGAGWAPRRLATGDFDGDGRLDVAAVVGKADAARASFLLNRLDAPPPDLRFRFANVRVTGKPHSITMGDFNADGFLDVTTCNGSQASFSVLFGTATGELVTSRAYISPGRASLMTMTSGDFDGDGDLDLAAGDAWTDLAQVRMNAGDGTFFDLSFVPLGATAVLLTTGEVNGDGRLDLVSANGGANTVSLLSNAGSGVFEAPRQIQVGSAPRAVVAHDLDADGDEDLAVANQISQEVSVLLNDGGGLFPSDVRYPVLGRASHLVASDLEGTGDVELVVAHDNWVTVFRNEGSGRFADELTVDTRQDPYSVLVADVDSDGTPDIVTSNTSNPAYGSLSVFLASGVREYQRPFRLIVGAEPRFAVAGDVDQDGDVDLVSANRTSDNVTMHRNEQSTFTDREQEFHRGDANGDGKVNLVDAIALATYLFRSGPAPACLKSADLDDDGKANLADVIYLLSFLHRDGPAPTAPHRECGTDPTEDALACDSFGPCAQ